MRFKVKLILKSGAKHEVEYAWDSIKSLSDAKGFIKTLLSSNQNAFTLEDDTRIDFYIKENIAVLSVEEACLSTYYDSKYDEYELEEDNADSL